MRRLLPFSFFAIAIAACGSDDLRAVPLPLPPPAAPAPGLSGRDTQLLSSSELVFDSAEGNGGKSPVRPSIGNRARLDVRGTKDVKIGVTLTPRWGQRISLTHVTAHHDKLLVGGTDDRVAVEFTDGKERDRWVTFTFPRAADGSLVGSFTATGELDVTAAGSSAAHAPLTGSGWLKNDELAPELRLSSPSKAQGGKWLPWDQVEIDLAEPLTAEPIKTELEKAFPHLNIVARDSSGDPRPESTGFRGGAKDFTSVTRTLSIGAQVKDPSGNLLAPFSTEFPVHVVGEARAKHDFDTSADLALWSGATRIADARCEKGGCLYFPPAPQTGCTPDGAAGLVTTSTGTGIIRRVHARVRVLASDPSTAPGGATAPLLLEPVYLRASPLLFFSATTHGNFNLKLLRTGTGDLPWESAWMTMNADVDPNIAARVIGFTLFRPVCEYMTIPIFNDARVAILIDEVWAE